MGYGGIDPAIHLISRGASRARILPFRAFMAEEPVLLGFLTPILGPTGTTLPEGRNPRDLMGISVAAFMVFFSVSTPGQ
jgi:hypothetical protein